MPGVGLAIAARVCRRSLRGRARPCARRAGHRRRGGAVHAGRGGRRRRGAHVPALGRDGRDRRGRRCWASDDRDPRVEPAALSGTARSPPSRTPTTRHDFPAVIVDVAATVDVVQDFLERSAPRPRRLHRRATALRELVVARRAAAIGRPLGGGADRPIAVVRSRRRDPRRRAGSGHASVRQRRPRGGGRRGVRPARVSGCREDVADRLVDRLRRCARARRPRSPRSTVVAARSAPCSGARCSRPSPASRATRWLAPHPFVGRAGDGMSVARRLGPNLREHPQRGARPDPVRAARSAASSSPRCPV